MRDVCILVKHAIQVATQVRVAPSNVSKGAKENNARHARMSYYLDPKFENRDVLPWSTTGVFSELEFAEATC